MLLLKQWHNHHYLAFVLYVETVYFVRENDHKLDKQ